MKALKFLSERGRLGYVHGTSVGFRLTKYFDCSECPFGAVAPDEEPPNYTDPPEGHYICALQNSIKVWGEDQDCSALWEEQIVKELREITKVE
jgi:hypothetical protein